MHIDVLFSGMSGRTSRGFLGWSSCVLLRRDGCPAVLFDTAGFNERAVLLDELAKRGVRPEDIGTVIISHFHFDHAANYGMFKGADCYLHELEVQHILNAHARDLAVPSEMFPVLRSSGRLRVLSGGTGTVEGFRWVHTPGHTPGLISLFLEYAGERWVLASDAVKNQRELATGMAGMTEDAAASASSIETIKAYADVVVPGHDGLQRVERTNGEIRVHTMTQTRVDVTLDPSAPAESRTIALES